ncbi:MAG: class I adenylate-forming enzyme family protein [Lentihominibacter sp.]|nr:acyl--CoA ligase [Clostridiales bacterium]MDY2680230.1 class I adenylate-forming enzyme family protein [Lentihominibacter sp.]
MKKLITESLEYPNGAMYEEVYKAAKKKPDVSAYEFQGRKTKYRDFVRKIERTAASFSAIGIKTGDRVTICMPNTPQAVDSFYALNRIGAVPAMIHPLSAVEEIKFYLTETKSKAIVTLDIFYEKIRKAAELADLPVTIIVASIKDELPFPKNMLYPLTVKNKPAIDRRTENTIKWAEFIREGKKLTQLPERNARFDDDAVILFSGGTTGKTKGILLTNMNINALALQTGAAAGFSLDGLRMLSVMPLFHGFGLGIGIHTPLIHGGTCILVPQFSVKTYADLIKKEKPNVLPGVPTLFEALLRTRGLQGFDMSFIRGMFCGGDSLSIELKRKVDAFLREHNASIQIREGYGTTECVTASCLTPYDYYKEGSIGVPFPDTYYKIVKPGTNEKLPPNHDGEICISGPSVMKGYLDNPEETAETLRNHGDGRIWLHTGDLGMMDEEGFIYFKQRLKRIIIVSGFNVYPSQVENAIDVHPDVMYSCAVGVPDEYKMHKVKAFVVLRSGVEPDDRIREEILENCRRKVFRYAVPYEIEFRDELPKTLVGKVAYRVLEEEINETLKTSRS